MTPRTCPFKAIPIIGGAMITLHGNYKLQCVGSDCIDYKTCLRVRILDNTTSETPKILISIDELYEIWKRGHADAVAAAVAALARQPDHLNGPGRR